MLSQPNLKVLPMTGMSNWVTAVLLSNSFIEGTILLEMRMKKIIRPYTLQAFRVLARPNFFFSTITSSEGFSSWMNSLL